MKSNSCLVKRYGSLFSRAIVCIALIGFVSNPSLAQDTSLWSWWNPERGDNFASTKASWSMPVDEISWSGEHIVGGPTREGYTLYRLEGFVFDSLDPQPEGTVPLFSWWNPERGDNFATTKTSWGMPVDKIRWSGEHIVNSPSREGYRLYRLEGYVFDPLRPQPSGTVPLFSWYHTGRGDNFVTTKTNWGMPLGDIRWSNEHIVNRPPVREGYQLYRLEGYIASSYSILERPVEYKTQTMTLPQHTTPQQVTYKLENGLAIYQGDIVLGVGDNFIMEQPEPHPTPRDFSEFGDIGSEKFGIGSLASPLVVRQSDGIIDRNWLWKNGIIPYKIGPRFSDDEKAVIRDAVDELNERTNLNIVTSWDVGQKRIVFKKRNIISGSGNSRVGRNRVLRQRVRLKDGFNNNTVIHELLHAAGFWHEQSRRDRDRYVQVLYENIKPGGKSNFDKHESDAEIVTPYDVNSIMHYGGFAFAKDAVPRQPTILNRATGLPVSPTPGLSDYDIDGINIVYPLDYFDSEMSRSPTSARNVKVEVLQIVSRDLDGPGDENEFYIKTEIGQGFEWRPGVPSNSTRRQISGKIRSSRLEARPNWTHSHLIAPNETYAKIWLQLREDDGLARNERKDDTFNINPFGAINEVELKIDTINGQIYLGDVDGVFAEENYIGDLGIPFDTEGFEGEFKANIVVNVTIE